MQSNTTTTTFPEDDNGSVLHPSDSDPDTDALSEPDIERGRRGSYTQHNGLKHLCHDVEPPSEQPHYPDWTMQPVDDTTTIHGSVEIGRSIPLSPSVAAALRVKARLTPTKRRRLSRSGSVEPGKTIAFEIPGSQKQYHPAELESSRTPQRWSQTVEPEVRAAFLDGQSRKRKRRRLSSFSTDTFETARKPVKKASSAMNVGSAMDDDFAVDNKAAVGDEPAVDDKPAVDNEPATANESTVDNESAIDDVSGMNSDPVPEDNTARAALKKDAILKEDGVPKVDAALHNVSPTRTGAALDRILVSADSSAMKSDHWMASQVL